MFSCFALFKWNKAFCQAFWWHSSHYGDDHRTCPGQDSQLLLGSHAEVPLPDHIQKGIRDALLTTFLWISSVLSAGKIGSFNKNRPLIHWSEPCTNTSFLSTCPSRTSSGPWSYSYSSWKTSLSRISSTGADCCDQPNPTTPSYSCQSTSSQMSCGKSTNTTSTTPAEPCRPEKEPCKITTGWGWTLTSATTYDIVTIANPLQPELPFGQI